MGPSDRPTGHHDSLGVQMISFPLSGSCLGNQVPEVGPQGHLADQGNSDSSFLVVLATSLLEDLQGLTASSEGACWAEYWALTLPAYVHGQRERGTDCLGQVDGDQHQGMGHHRCTDCRFPVVLKRVLRHLLAVAAAVVRHGRAHCTLPRDVLMEGKHLPQDVCNSAFKKKKKYFTPFQMNS